MAELKKLTIQRGALKGQLTRFYTFLEEFNETSESVIRLRARFDAFSSIFSEFNTIQVQIEYLDETNEHAEENNLEREHFETKYFEVIARCKEILGRHQSQSQIVIAEIGSNSRAASPTSNNSSSNVNASSSTPAPAVNISSPNLNTRFNIKLPQVNLPEFHGQYDKWTQFHETFNSLINDNPSLSNIQKFYYLQGCLKGEASQIISSFTISESNYSEAWNLLKDRYQNKKAIINSHLKGIFDLPNVTKEDHISLRRFLDAFLKHFRSLKHLDGKTDNWDTILIFLLISKLDIVTKKEWETSSANNILPSTDDFITFLTKRCNLLESINNKLSTSSQVHVKKQLEYKSTSHITTTEIDCPLCQGNHYIYKCKKFLSLPIHTRFAEAKRLNLCTNCLRRGHSNSECKAGTCKSCQKRHNSLLHASAVNPRESQNIINGANSENSSNNSSVNKLTAGNAAIPSSSQQNITPKPCEESTNYCGVNANCSKKQAGPFVVLSTAVVNACDSGKHLLQCRALLDSGSESNFVTREFATRLGLKTLKASIPVLGISQARTHITSKTYIKIQSRHNNYSVKLPFLIIDNITGLTPQQSFEISDLDIPESIKLADCEFNKSSSINMLLGAGIFFDLLCVGQIKLGPEKPILHKTKLGWIISGQINNQIYEQNVNQACFLNINSDFHDNIERFWSIEEAYPQFEYSREEIECENHFSENTYRDSSGRFVVKLPLRDNYVNLGESRQAAINRFLSIERKLLNNPGFNKSYSNFMSEYQSLGHMTEVKLTNIAPTHYFLPHHGVEKSDSLTTRLRVVFDASAKTTTGISLNDTLKVGPNIQQDLLSILLRFRKHNVVLVGDIAKMYRQVQIDPDQRDLQLIVWREDPSEDLKYFQLNTVTYGTASASFLSTRCVKQVAIDNFEKFPEESKIIMNDFYIDDLLTGSTDDSTLLNIQRNLTKILKQAGFELRKFNSNSEHMISNILNDSNQPKIESYIITDNTNTKTLGIVWNPTADQFVYNSQTKFINQDRPTKRSILALIAQIFDPMGLLGPIVMQAKLIMQQLWRLGLDWDESIPTDLHTSWSRFHSQLAEVNTIPIPRRIMLPNSISTQLHGFSDASEKGYGACVYIRSVKSKGDLQTSLVCAKSRVAPIKSITIPRLELCGALLLAQLANKVITALDMPINRTFYWTDSSIVLSWLSADPHNWQTFVCNRISQIQQITQIDDWHHVSSSNNPADLISRGLTFREISNCNLWWHGPPYLSESEENWPEYTHISKYAKHRNEQNFPEFRRNQVNYSLVSTHDFSIFEKFSKLSTLLVVVAYCMRFKKNCKSVKGLRTIGPLTYQEIAESKQVLIKLAQSQAFSHDIQSLRKHKSVKPSSKLSSLNPFLDGESIIRVGGRIKHSRLSFNQCHPILLPSKHPFTRLIIRDCHIRNLHVGARTTLSCVRQNYWPLSGMLEVKSIIHKCIPCFKAKPHAINPQMGELPPSRVIPNRIFSSCGIDYAGPVFIRDGKTRNRKIIKAYICVFVCMSSKATHLELVTELSASMFLNALKRFVARRGLCSHIYSDNATNFTRANRELLEFQKIIQQETIQYYFREQGIQWHYIPARSPNFGGLWEAAVKSVKHHLKRILNNIHLTYEEFNTFLTQIEAVLNSRPLIPLSNDPHDLEILTPGHFIIGEPLNSIPEPNTESKHLSPVARYHHILQMTQHFWSRWSNEYLHNLQQRSKWRFQSDGSSLVGALVLLKEDHTPPQHWPKGRIVEVHPGADGVVRVISVKTPSGVVKRAVMKVCVLPTDAD